MDDLYAVLGVDPDASADDVRAAYRSLAHRFHPDHNQQNQAAVRRMQEINEAFAVLNSPDGRREYDLRRGITTATAAYGNGANGVGRGQRPYFRGANWGLHNGADAPPEHIVRVSPASFNLVVSAPGDRPVHSVTLQSGAPFAVHVRLMPSDWLSVPAVELTLGAGASVELEIAVSEQASAVLRGWRDGGVSFVTDDSRVYCPDLRVTGIFLTPGQTTAQQVAQARQVRAQDLRTAPSGADADGIGSLGDEITNAGRGWLRRIFGT